MPREFKHTGHMRRQLDRDMAGVMLRDWYTLADLILARLGDLVNADDPLPIYRSILADARLTDPSNINRHHLDLIRGLVLKGVTHATPAATPKAKPTPDRPARPGLRPFRSGS